MDKDYIVDRLAKLAAKYKVPADKEILDKLVKVPQPLYKIYFAELE